MRWTAQVRRPSIPFGAIGPGARAPESHTLAATPRRVPGGTMMPDEKKPTQLPPEAQEAVGKIPQSDFNNRNRDADEAKKGDSKD